MKQALKILLFYFFLLQIIAPLVIGFLSFIYALIIKITTGVYDNNLPEATILLSGQYLGMALITLYLWRKGYFNSSQMTEGHVKASNYLLSVLMMLAGIWMLNVFTNYTQWIPDLLEDKYDIIFGSWTGILCVAVVAPIVEELVFRGAITRILLKTYSPWKGILISAAIFGLFHINPAQIIPAFLMGIVFAWVYYKTDNILPCCVMHILNNSIAVYITKNYSEIETLDDFLSVGVIFASALAAGIIFALCWKAIDRKTKAIDWQKTTLNEETNILQN